MNRINESVKLTLTIGQIRRLVAESITEADSNGVVGPPRLVKFTVKDVQKRKNEVLASKGGQNKWEMIKKTFWNPKEDYFALIDQNKKWLAICTVNQDHEEGIYLHELVGIVPGGGYGFMMPDMIFNYFKGKTKVPAMYLDSSPLDGEALASKYRSVLLKQGWKECVGFWGNAAFIKYFDGKDHGEEKNRQKLKAKYKTNDKGEQELDDWEEVNPDEVNEASETTLTDLLAYCRSSIDDFDYMEREALDEIDHSRCSLHQASPELYDKMMDAIDEYCMDNGIENDFDPEDVFWAGD